MKTHRHLRGISFLLSFLMVVSLFTVCGFGALAETKDLTVKTFAGHDLYEAALTDAVKNELDHQIFTSFRDSVGRRSTMPDNFMLHSVPVLRSDSSGNLAFEQGDDIRVTIRVWTDETYVDGNLFQFEFAYNAELGREDLTQIEQIDYDTYMNASSDVDPVTGLEYKEFDLFYPLDHQDFNNPSMSGQLRVKALNEAPLSVYFLGCYNESKEGMVLGEYEGNEIASQSGYNFEDIYLSDVASGVASYCSNDAQIGRDNAVEPYMYNCKGANNDNTRAAGSLAGSQDSGRQLCFGY